MAKTQEYNSNMTYQGRNTFNPQRAGNYGGVASAIGNSSNGQQLSQIGNVVAGFGGWLAKDYDARQNANVNDAINAMQADFTTWKTAQSQKQGKDALTTAQDYEKFKTETIAKYTQGFNDTERGRFDSNIGKIVATQNAWANEYEYSQEQAYLDSNTQASYKNAANAIIATPQSLGAELERIDQLQNEYILRKGMGEEAAQSYKRNINTQVYSDVITARINENNLGAAQATLERSKGFMNEDKFVAYQEQIKAKREANFKRHQAEQEKIKKAEEQKVIDDATNEVLNLAGSFPDLVQGQSAALNYIDKKYADNKELRNKLANAVTAELSYQDKVQKATAASELVSFNNAVAGRSPTEQSRLLEYSSYSEKGKALISKQISEVIDKPNDNNIQATQEIKMRIDEANQQGLFIDKQDVLALAVNGELTSKQIEDVAKYFDEQGAVGGLTQTAISNAYKEVFNDKPSAKEAERLGLFLKQNIELGRKPEPQELAKLASQFYIEGTVHKDALFSINTPKTYSEAVEAGEGAKWLPSVDDNEEAYINAQLEAMGYNKSNKNRAIFKRNEMMDIPDVEYIGARK